MLLFLPAAAADTCWLATIASRDRAFSVPLAAEALPVGSLVRVGSGPCDVGVPVEVLAVEDTLPVAGAAHVGARGCVAKDVLEPLGERWVVNESLAQTWPGLEHDIPCDATQATPGIPLTALADARVRLADQVVAYGSVLETWSELFPGNDARIQMNPFGRVALPLHERSPEEIEVDRREEGLGTPEQQARGVVALGPMRGSVAVYDHFRGTDGPGVDTWATHATIVHLLRLASGWFDDCAKGVDPRRCTLHIGDLAYVDDRRPDPLGHKDHSAGACVDVRLFRTDTSRYEAWWNRPDDRTGRTVYDRDRTVAFLRYAYAHAPLGDVFFNDPAVIAAVPGVRPLKGHDDHIHMCFAG